MLEPGERLGIAIGQAPRIWNDIDEPLGIIEVQRGDYVGEDDIGRLDDYFGRA